MQSTPSSSRTKAGRLTVLAAAAAITADSNDTQVNTRLVDSGAGLSGTPGTETTNGANGTGGTLSTTGTAALPLLIAAGALLAIGGAVLVAAIRRRGDAQA